MAHDPTGTEMDGEMDIDATSMDGSDSSLIGELHPLNKPAKDAFRRLAQKCDAEFYGHHAKFLDFRSECFVFYLQTLPELGPLGYRFGSGDRDARNSGVDIVIATDDDTVADHHGRFAWLTGGGGFFLIADNKQGKTITLNGEVLLPPEKRLIPFHNTIGIGELFFTFRFPKRTRAEDEQFQLELATFYEEVMKDPTSLPASTPRGKEVILQGEWMIRRPMARRNHGFNSAVSNTRTGEIATAKELCKASFNAGSVGRELEMAKKLKNLKHANLATTFSIRRECVLNKANQEHMAKQFGDNWKPEFLDFTEKYIMFSPFSNCTFYSLVQSEAPPQMRTILFTQVLEGLAFLHKHGITHCDIRPKNLTVQSYNPPLARIIDFGSATTETKMLYTFEGYTPYLAPEQLVDQYYGREVDYWAAALVGVDIAGCSEFRLRLREKHDVERIRAWIDGELDKSPPAPRQALLNASRAMLRYEPASRMTPKRAVDTILAGYRARSLSNKRSLAESA